jgi:hypothetical protein
MSKVGSVLSDEKTAGVGLELLCFAKPPTLRKKNFALLRELAGAIKVSIHHFSNKGILHPVSD